MSVADNLYIIERKMLYKELKPLFEAMSSINYAVVKGEVLSQQIYGVLDKRRSSDIDILIDKKNVRFLEIELQKLGFKQQLLEDVNESRRNRVLCMAYSHQIPSYHKDIMGFHLNVDVNYDIFWGEYEGKRYPIEEFLNDTVDMEIYGVTVKTLPVEKAFVQLILHHYKEMNSLYHLSQHNCIRTEMFKDIYDMLLNKCHLLTVDRTKQLCEKYSIGNYAYYMLYYAYQVFEDIALYKYLKPFEYYMDFNLINGYGLSSQERKVWKISFEQRLDKNEVWSYIRDDLTEADMQKVILNNSIFT